MKIAILTSGFAPVPAVDSGAVEQLTSYLIFDNEKSQDIQFDVYTIADKRLNTITLKNTKIIQININKLLLFIEKNINRIYRKLQIHKTFSIYNIKLLKLLKSRNEGYDVIVFENLMDIIFEIEKIKISNTCILHLHNDLNNTSKTIAMGKKFNELNSKIIGVSNYIINSYIEKTNASEKNCAVLHNCIDKSVYNDIINKFELEKLRKRMGLKSNDFILLYVGRINEEKGIRELINAFSKIQNNDIKLMICGGTWGSEFKNNKFLNYLLEVLDKKVDDVIFTGYINSEDLKNYYYISDIVIIPSKVQEAFGMVMLEAGIIGKPIIATKSGGMVEILDDKSVIFVENDENLSISLEKMINEAYEHKDKLEDMGMRARKKILESNDFDRENYYNQFMTIVKNHYNNNVQKNK